MTTESINRDTTAQVAADAIKRVMDFGQPIHGNKWVNRENEIDLAHIRRHLDMFEDGDESEPHIEHALTRMAFILSRPIVRR
jgi:hypothetical protein